MIQPNGDIVSCCAILGRMTDDQQQVYNVNTHNISDFWNSQEQKQLRLDLINGKEPECCNSCWKLENKDHTKGNSVRKNANDRIPLSRVQDRIQYAAENNGELNVDWIDMQISTGNLCNLACKMCGPDNSIQYSEFFLDRNITTKQQIKFSKTSIGVLNGGEFGDLYDWPVKRPLATILKDHYSSLETVWLTGGEPTIIKENIDFLEDLVTTGHSQHILAFINTNCTNVNKRLLDILGNFDQVMFNLSIDAIDDIAYIQRTPSRWPYIQKNIDSIFDWLAEKNNPRNSVNFNTVITNLNFHQVPEVWQHLITRYSPYKNVYLGFGFTPVVKLEENFGIESVPEYMRDQVQQQLDALKILPPVVENQRLRSAITDLEYHLNTINFSKDNENIHFMLDRLQEVHPELNIKEIYSIYYR